MSATMDADILLAYFGKEHTKIINVPGRMYRVDVFYLRNAVDDYIEAAIQTAFQLLLWATSKKKESDMLVFLPGQEEISIFCAGLQKRLESILEKTKKDNFLILPLYAALPRAEQEKIFVKTSKIKVIGATTIAETSITIPGIRYIIDPGLVKCRRFCGQTGLESLEITSASRAQSEQRRGRAGREAPGFCYRLYPESQFEQLLERRPPDIQQTELSSVVLRLLALGISRPQDFDYLTKPPRSALLRALETLYALQALDAQGSLTQKGQLLAELPLAPLFGNLILLAREEQYSSIADPLLALVATLSANDDARSFFLHSSSNNNAFADPGSDLLTDLNVFLTFLKEVNTNDFCHANGLRRSALQAARYAYQQLRAIDKKHQRTIIPATLDYDRDLLLNCLVAGLATVQTAIRDHQKRIYTTLRGQHQVFLHPSSILHARNPPPDALVFASCVSTNKRYIRGLSAFSPDRLPDLVPHLYISSSSLVVMPGGKKQLQHHKISPQKKRPKAVMFNHLPISASSSGAW
uniref:Helicase C-terminal domain-containing protein n=1 Tax=Aureoumbra lagunensis TaxID=44058 RepID=A0A7S3NQF1_9STRA